MDELRTDAMGNVFAIKKGRGDRTVMLAAHMDEIGFIIKHIDKKGFLRIQPLGGFDPRQLFAQRVRVSTVSGDALPGVLCYATKPPHLMTEVDKTQPKVDQFFVDVGMTPEEVQEQFRIGGMVTMDREFVRCGHCFASKCLDNRVGVFVMLEAMRRIEDPEVTVVAVATTQEEIGLRGATTAAFAVQPDVGIALDTTIAADDPGGTDDAVVTRLGQGAGIKIMDGSLVCHPLVVEHMRQLAEQEKIPHQMEVLPRGGTDGGALQRAASGCACMTLSIPTRYIHTVNEMVHEEDVAAAIDLLSVYLMRAHEGQYDWE